MTPHQLPPDLKREVEEALLTNRDPMTEPYSYLQGATWMYERAKKLEPIIEMLMERLEYTDRFISSSGARHVAFEALEEFRKGRLK